MRGVALAMIAAAAAASAQVKPTGALPAMAPTQSVSDLPSAHPALAPSVAAEDAKVSWDGAVLRVDSKGDNLRNIVRAISQVTGMRITGGVPEEPVFGTYGPGAVQDVLPQLFDGIAVNMMLVNDGATKPKELVLTQRTGAATPPQVRAISDEEQGFGRRRGFGQQRNGPQGGPPPQAQQTAPPPQPVVPPQSSASDLVQPGTVPGTVQQNGITIPTQLAPDASGTPAATGTDASGQPQSPNGVRTPEQIFEELRKRQAAAQGGTSQ